MTINDINAILDQEHLVETNEGTFGPEEACRKVGSGDPAFANYRVYKTLRGSTRHEGVDKDAAPGRARYFALPKLDKAKITQMATQIMERANQIVRDAERYVPPRNTEEYTMAKKEVAAVREILKRYGKK